MAESILEDDKDEWFYNSLARYTNLYMFDLEFPVDAMETIDNTSICISGIQNFSRKCEILQLSLPIKLLPKYLEDGLCKDRDFKILSGGYAEGRITQIKPISSFPNFLSTVQNGVGGCTIFKLGDDEHGVIQQEAILTFPDLAHSKTSTMATFKNRIIVNSVSAANPDCENVLHEWKLESGHLNSSVPTKHSLVPSLNNIGTISKIKYWDENTVAFCSRKGFISMIDSRDRNSSTSFSITPAKNSNSSLFYSFDCIPSQHKLGSIDSDGGYVSTDARYIKETSLESRRKLLPGMDDISAVLGDKFNLEYEPNPSADKSKLKFLVTGLKQDVVPVFMERSNSAEVVPVFTHDGHSKTVTQVCWHTLTENLLFSTSVDAVLHAWQYVGE